MSRTALPLFIGDISSFSKSLRNLLSQSDKLPSHVEMLNVLAKAGGFKNFQHFKAEHGKQDAQPEQSAVPAEVNHKLVNKLVRYFDEQGRLIRWPGKYSQRVVCLWIMWSRIPAKTTFSEKEISRFLEGQHLFGDHALLRRELVDRGMMERTPDGRRYIRLEVRPPAEALALLERLKS